MLKDIKDTVMSAEKAYLRVRNLFKFRYEKLISLIIIIVLSYILFTHPYFSEEISAIKSLGYFSIFIAGLLFSFGFTAPFAIGIFLSTNPSNIFIAAALGGIAATLSDLLIFKIIKLSLIDEFSLLEKTWPLKTLSTLINKSFSYKIRIYLLYTFAGIIIASPLPDELGVTMLAGLTHIKAKILAPLSFCLNTLGIFILLLIR